MFYNELNCFPINWTSQGPGAAEMLCGEREMQRPMWVSFPMVWVGLGSVFALLSSPRAWALGDDMFRCGSFPNSWVWTWRSWKKLKKMLGWETEDWAAWQVSRGEGSPLLTQRA